MDKQIKDQLGEYKSLKTYKNVKGVIIRAEIFYNDNKAIMKDENGNITYPPYRVNGIPIPSLPLWANNNNCSWKSIMTMITRRKKKCFYFLIHKGFRISWI